MAYNSYKPQPPRAARRMKPYCPHPPHDSKGVYMDNNMKFNQMLNSSPYGRQIYDLLWLVASKPAVKQTKDIGEKRQVIIREIISILNEPQSSQQAV